MTTLPIDFLKELDTLADDVGVNKNEIIIAAVRFWKRRRAQYLLAKSYALTDVQKRELAAIARKASTCGPDAFP